MVAPDRIENFRRFLSELSSEFHADCRMPAFHLVVHGLPDVVQESATSGNLSIKSQLISDHLAEKGDFNRVTKHILALGSRALVTPFSSAAIPFVKMPTRELDQCRVSPPETVLAPSKFATPAEHGRFRPEHLPIDSRPAEPSLASEDPMLWLCSWADDTSFAGHP